MKSEFVDCFMLIGTALSLNHNQKLPEMGRPLISDVATTFINVSLTIQEIRFINIPTMEIEVTSLLHQRWVDPRLGSNSRTRKMAVAGQIWRPKITITKGLVGAGLNNEDTQFWRGFGDEGNILLSEKLVIETFCTNNLGRFPFDFQICDLKFGTYRFPIDEVELIWHCNPVEILTGTSLNEFELVNVSTFHEVEVRPSGNFSNLVMQIVVKRNSLHYALCLMIPCMVLVVLSYVSLWLDYNRIGLRLGVSIAAFLFLLHLFRTSICLIPGTSFLKLIDLFILKGLTFSSFSVLVNCIISSMCSNLDFSCLSKDSSTEETYRKFVMWIERSVKVLLPLLYLFCVVIFIYCVL